MKVLKILPKFNLERAMNKDDRKCIVYDKQTNTAHPARIVCTNQQYTNNTQSIVVLYKANPLNPNCHEEFSESFNKITFAFINLHLVNVRNKAL